MIQAGTPPFGQVPWSSWPLHTKVCTATGFCLANTETASSIVRMVRNVVRFMGPLLGAKYLTSKSQLNASALDLRSELRSGLSAADSCAELLGELTIATGFHKSHVSYIHLT